MRNKTIEERSQRLNKNFFFLYTLLFSVMLFFLLYLFLKEDYSLLRIGDSYNQHLKALIYFSKYFREIFSVLINEHRLVIPQWDFEIGLGSDIITTFSYYVVGDPFNLLSIFVPEKYIHIYYQIIIIMRIYVSGIVFSYLCFYTGNKNLTAVTAGALTYCFSSYAVYAGLKHAYFINPMIFLPLILIGVEKILNNKGVGFFTAAVALSALSNFYFFYMLVILTVVYVAVRLIALYSAELRTLFAKLFRISLGALNGVMISAVIFLPTIIGFLGDNRRLTQRNIELFYPANTYKNLILSFFTYGRANVWLAVCVSAVFFPCLISLFLKRKKNTELKVLYIISLVFMCLPFFGTFLNGFSYICHRWCFGYVLLMSYIIAVQWENFINSDKKRLLIISFFSVMAAGYCFFYGKSRSIQLVLPFSMLFITLGSFFIFRLIKRKRFSYAVRNILCLIFCIISALNCNYFLISPSYGNYLSEFFKTENTKNLTYPSNTAILQAAENDQSFFRHSGRKLATNASFIDSLKSTQFYWSISNGNISQFREKMNLAENILYKYEGFDDRTALNALACVKYFYNADKNNSSLPYGFTPVTDTVSVNTLPLPFGYTYDEYITSEDYDSLSSVAKQEIMLTAAFIEKETSFIKKANALPKTKELDYSISFIDKNVKLIDGKFVTNKKGAKIELAFEALPDSETYISFSGITCAKLTKNPVTFELEAETATGQTYTKSFFYYTEKANFYAGREDFDVNLGYTESGICKVTVTFPHKDTYCFDSLKIYAQPMSEYEDSINSLKENILENIIFDYNIIKGSVSLKENKLLCLSMPYSKGWKAFVDGNETELIKTNGMYCGILMGKGEHEVELVYSTPGLISGLIITVFGIAFFVTVTYNHRRKALKKNATKKM